MQMVRLTPFLLLFWSIGLGEANAQDATRKMGECLVSSTTGADRIALVRWIGFSIAAHPALAENLAITPSAINAADVEVAQLFTDLITVRCRQQTIEAYAADGDSAVEGAFRVLGEAAMMEATTAPDVGERMNGFLKHLDESLFDDVFQ